MLKTLKHIIQEVNAATDLQQSLDLLVLRVASAMQVDASSIFLVDRDKNDYVLMATVGLNTEMVGRARIKCGEGLIGLVGEREEPINIDNAPAHPRYHHFKKLNETAYGAFLGTPIIYQGDLLGVLIVQQKTTRFFSEEEEAFLVTLSTQLSSVIAHAHADGALQLLTQKNRRKKMRNMLLQGLPGSPGVGVGKAVMVYAPADLDAVPDREADNIPDEIEIFESALQATREEIYQLQSSAKSSLSIAETALFDAYLRLLDSRSLFNEVEQAIRAGQWAQGAVKRVIKQHILHFESLDDPYLCERATDMRDLGRRILSHIQSREKAQPVFPKNAILVSEEVTATALMEVPTECLVGVISGSGSSNSHVAILARALGLPTVMGVSGKSVNALSGKEVIVDGYSGEIYISPSPPVKKVFKKLALEEAQLDEALADLRELPAETKDGHRIPLYVNTGLAAEGGLSLSVGAEGVGLFRTEMPFMVRDRFPSEEEQRVMYRQLLNTFAPRPVTMRTLDVGGDKMLPYFVIQEDNPFLGWRGIRVTLDHPDIFLQQIRAMLHASVGLNNLSVLFPMISSVREVDEALRLLDQAYRELRDEKIKVKRPLVGLMIEVPVAIYQAQILAKRVDFISVGSNDLIQYLLAVDRNNPRVANRYDGLHPSVLQALQQIVTLGHKAKRPVSICGELASDPVAVVLLLAMGFDALSINARSLPRVKWIIRQFTLKKAKKLLKEVLAMHDPAAVRVHMELALTAEGLGGLIRAGKT